MASPSPADRLRPVPKPPGAASDRGGAGSSLPAPLTTLVGRENETAAVSALLRREEVRLVTLTGPGGVGKTRLALRVAEEVATDFADGIRFVPLAAITDPGLVLPTVARALGARDTGDRSLVAQLHALLQPRDLLLILDNMEQVLPAAPDLAGLLAACPRLTILATSRALLRVSGEHGFPVLPLPLPELPALGSQRRDGQRLLARAVTSDAVRLFLDRARAVDPDLTLTANNAADVAEICHRLDGLPLAIELAAARSNTFSPAELVTRLERRLPLLTGGPRDQPPRLRTMRDAIAWGHDLLDPAERVALHQLAIFAGGFTLEAAEIVGGPEDGGQKTEGEPSPITHHPSPITFNLVASLVDHGLLRREQSGAAPPRFVMLETIREFAFEQLAGSGEAEVMARRHAEWCVAFVERIQRAGGLSQGRWLAAVEAEHPNFRAALRWLLDRGEVATALHLTGLLAEFWLRHGHLTEGAGWLEQALAADTGGPSAERVAALVGLNMLLWPRDRFARAGEVLGEAEAAARTAGDDRALAYARLHQGYLAAFRGDPDLAMARGEEAVAFYTAAADPIHLDGALWLLARSALARGEDTRALENYERLLSTARGWGDEISIANGLLGRAILAERRGDTRQALANYAEVAAVCLGFGDGWGASLGLDGAAAAAVALGRPEAAVRLFGAAEALRQGVGGEPVSPFVGDRSGHARALAAARDALGPVRFAGVMAAGGALSLPEAVAEARALSLLESEKAVPPVAGSLLTARERTVLQRLAGGQSDKEIAAAMGITRRTASNHVAAILAKLDAPSRTAAAALAFRDGLV